MVEREAHKTDKVEDVKVKPSATNELFNKEMSITIDGRVIKIWRISVESLEIATATILKLVMMFQPGAGFFNLVNKEDIAVVREVIASCSDISQEDLKKMPFVSFLKIFDKWLEVNEGELVEASKLFLSIKERLQKLNDTMIPTESTK